MSQFRDRHTPKIALSFDGLIIIKLGCKPNDIPYWAVQNAIAFAKEPDGTVTILAPYGWHDQFVGPHHVVQVGIGGGWTFGKLATVAGPGKKVSVVGDERDFNPHYFEPSIV